MAEQNDTDKDAKAAKAASAKAAKAADDEPAVDGPKPRRAKRPTGKFVALMNIDLAHPKKGRVHHPEGAVMPEYVSEEELAKFQEAGVIDHQYE